MPRLQENLFLLIPIHDLYRSSPIKLLVCTPQFFYLKIYGILTQILQKRPSQTPAVAQFRDIYLSISKKSVSTDSGQDIFSN